MWLVGVSLAPAGEDQIERAVLHAVRGSVAVRWADLRRQQWLGITPSYRRHRLAIIIEPREQASPTNTAPAHASRLHSISSG